MLCRSQRRWLAVSSQVGLHRDYMSDLELVERKHSSEFLLLRRCAHQPVNVSERCDINMNVHQYPHVLQVLLVCLVFLFICGFISLSRLARRTEDTHLCVHTCIHFIGHCSRWTCVSWLPHLMFFSSYSYSQTVHYHLCFVLHIIAMYALM